MQTTQFLVLEALRAIDSPRTRLAIALAALRASPSQLLSPKSLHALASRALADDQAATRQATYKQWRAAVAIDQSAQNAQTVPARVKELEALLTQLQSRHKPLPPPPATFKSLFAPLAQQQEKLLEAEPAATAPVELAPASCFGSTADASLAQEPQEVTVTT